MNRRKIDFYSAEEVIQDIKSLNQNGYQRCGQWNLTQICQHLTATMDGGMDGFGFRLPWILRATVLKWGFRYALRKRKLGRGFPTFKSLKPTFSPEQDSQPIIEDCIKSCQRAAHFSGSLKDYALLNNLSVKDWQDFMWIHATHHLSFLSPSTSSAS